MQLSCYECALRACGLFKPITPEELNVINQIKRDHLSVPAGGEIVRAGDEAPELYTLYSGWAFRFKTLPDGRRQILNFLLPGDLLGLQAAMFDAALHGIEALTEVELCVLPRRDIWKLFGDMPALAFDVTWLGSREEGIVDENLTSAGRRTAAERVAALIVALYKRAKALGLTPLARFVTYTTAYHRCYWISIEGMERQYQRAEVDAHARRHYPRGARPDGNGALRGGQVPLPRLSRS